ncbi:hypothetical protein [Morganella psychrotolerans]|uniref:Uncharacterized protein n=1 Tax=Morganella psychrotolerans TaxID=368603 RepID=A0A1B8HCS7_9GAMM|nr:hypothetical protein [Morganella psychrotolerans]OBU06869.1 hypothetical protein AYY18_19750 [Morganella psychrotolerans]
MSNKDISPGISIEQFVYDMALSLTNKDPNVSTPEEFTKRMLELMPECQKAAENNLPKAVGFFSRKR